MVNGRSKISGIFFWLLAKIQQFRYNTSYCSLLDKEEIENLNADGPVTYFITGKRE
jgi:hypothetical protein